MFEPDLWIFQKVWNWQKRKQQARAISAVSASTVYLKDIEFRLAQLAYAISHNRYQVKTAELHGGIQSNTFFLPEKIELTEDKNLNTRAYIHRLALAYEATQLPFRMDQAVKKTLAHIDMSLLCLPTLLKRSFASFPSLAGEHRILLQAWVDNNRKGTQTPAQVFYRCWIKAIIFPKTNDFPAGLVTSQIDQKDDLLRLYLELETLKRKMNVQQDEIDFVFPIVWPFLPFEDVSSQLTKMTQNPLADPNALPSGTEKEAPTKESVKRVSIQENDEDAMPVTHVLEKVTTADIFDGGLRTIEGADELSSHYDALNELDVREVVRTHRKTQSIYHADISYHIQYTDAVEDMVDADFRYDEWNHKKRRYLRDWCGLKQHALDGKTKDFQEKTDYLATKKQIKQLRAIVEKIQSDKKKQKKQYDGQEVDVDALTDRYAELKAGISKTDKLYIKQRRAEKDVAIVLLLDASLSTDSWVQGRRVMDVIKESVYIVSHVFEDMPIQVGVFGFYSNTRKDCHYVCLKDFNDPWKVCQNRLHSLEPTGYTRIGPAIRHSNFLLQKTGAKKQTILLISDGKPTDYDAYEGVYGVEDIRQAIRESRSQKISVQSLAIDKQAKVYFPQMFGKGNYDVLVHTRQLPMALTKLFTRLVH